MCGLGDEAVPGFVVFRFSLFRRHIWIDLLAACGVVLAEITARVRGRRTSVSSCRLPSGHVTGGVTGGVTAKMNV